MKTILKIIAILLVASVVAGGFSLAINNTSSSSGTIEGGQLPAMTVVNDQSTTQPMAQPEGGDEVNGSIAGGLSGIFFTLVKLTGIAAIVLLLEKAFNALGNRKLSPAQR